MTFMGITLYNSAAALHAVKLTLEARHVTLVPPLRYAADHSAIKIFALVNCALNFSRIQTLRDYILYLILCNITVQSISYIM